MPTTRIGPPRPFETATQEDLYYCYRLLLGREPDEVGRANWMRLIEEQSVGLEELTRGFLDCREFRRRGRGRTVADNLLELTRGILGRRIAGEPDPAESGHRPSLVWKLMQLLLASSKQHAFLDRAYTPWLFRITPRHLRTPLALQLLSLSPHYWIYQWTDRYPVAIPRPEVLRREFERNADSRRQLCEQLMTRFLRPDMTVLDFGCGPGFLAREVSEHVGLVVATDISRGVIACAKHLNSASNLKYITNGPSNLARVEPSSIDLVYSFAVFQHLLKEQTLNFFQEFARILKPRGTGVIHTIIRETTHDSNALYRPSWVEERVNLRMVYFTESELEALLNEAGFSDVQIARVETICEIEDDIGNEHLVKFRR